jgi:hypothetical protein
MREVITIQIIRPNFEVLNEVGEKQMIEEMAKDIAKQILTQEKLRHMSENIAYWQKKFLMWEVEDQARETYEKPKRTD